MCEMRVRLDWVGLKMREKKKLAQLPVTRDKKISMGYLRISVLPLVSFPPFLPPPFFLPLSSLFPLLPLLKRYKIESPPSPLHSSVFF